MKLKLLSVCCGLMAMFAFAAVGHSEPTTQPTAGTATVTGKILGVDGAPAAGVTVRLTKQDSTATPGEKGKKGKVKGANKGADGFPGMTATTDDKGEYKIADVAAGTYDLVANLKGTGRALSTVTVTDGQATAVDLTLKAPKHEKGEKKNK